MNTIIIIYIYGTLLGEVVVATFQALVTSLQNVTCLALWGVDLSDSQILIILHGVKKLKILDISDIKHTSSLLKWYRYI